MRALIRASASLKRSARALQVALALSRLGHLRLDDLALGEQLFRLRLADGEDYAIWIRVAVELDRVGDHLELHFPVPIAGLLSRHYGIALLLGRVTYEAMQAMWPTAEGEFADRMNELPKYVVSSTLTDPPWSATVLGDDWAQEVARLRKELNGDIVVYGSRGLSRALMGMGLVDEVRLMVYPVLLGAGDRLFGEMEDKVPMRLVQSRPSGDGVLNLIYAPARADG
jgi:dihydrofolate reductase